MSKVGPILFGFLRYGRLIVGRLKQHAILLLGLPSLLTSLQFTIATL